MPKPQKYRDVVKVLRASGWVVLRQGKGSHELWGLPDQSVRETIAHHDEVSAGVIRQLMRKLPAVPQEWR
ncbi:type II toxin-antitoxin system HicA family toxin [Rathayibacter agropyri]